MTLPLLYTQVNCVQNNQVLLMRRNKEPNFGKWVAPGGKIEWNESMQDCAVRELREETGLIAHEVILRGIVTLVLPDLAQHCIHFLYLVTKFSGNLIADLREGELQWWPIAQLDQLEMPPANRRFLPHGLKKPNSKNEPIYQAKYVYDTARNIIEVVEYSSCRVN
ncbi:8-oxo-dGTP diphosphatase [Chloroflexi bacterium TSY]|nr:8-oxo-dGTP diphosphatase [Chloroflexi bacterium TSY]